MGPLITTRYCVARRGCLVRGGRCQDELQAPRLGILQKSRHFYKPEGHLQPAHNVSAIALLNPSALSPPSTLSQQPRSARLPRRDRPSHLRPPHLCPPCLVDRHPAQGHPTREARQVPAAVTPATPTPQTAAPVSWAAALGAGKAGTEDETVSAHVPQRGNAAVLVLDQQVDPHVD